MMYSVFGVTKAPPCSDLKIGLTTICLVSKSRRSITARRGLALSLMKRNWPSYSPLVSEIAGWWVSPQVIDLPSILPWSSTALEFSS
jgi:hypothetical protein